jgi:hypothetical protein
LRWDGGPLEVARRAKDKALSDPTVRQAIATWYDPATLSLLDGMPVNCLLVTFSGGGAEIANQQRRLVKEYARKAHERGLSVLGLVYPGSKPATVAAEAAAAGLDGVVIEGEFPGGPAFADQVRRTFGTSNSALRVIPVEATAESLRKADWPVLAVEGVAPGVGKLSDTVTASATSGVWVDSNLWLVRSLRPGAGTRPVWLTHRAAPDSPGKYLKSIADAAAVGARWVITLDDELRLRLRNGEAKATAEWRNIAALVKFFADHAEWANLAPYGKVGIILDAAGPNLAVAEEYLNLVGRRQIPYRVIDRTRCDAAALAGLRAVLAFDLAPPSEAERRVLSEFAGQGGLVLGGPAWGQPPKEQAYTVQSVEEGEVAVYKDDPPDPESVARDLNDLLTTPDFGVSFFNAPSVLPYVSGGADEERMTIQLVNYADQPAELLTIWAARKFASARFFVPGSAPVELALKRSGGRTEVAVPRFGVYAALVLE